MESLLYRYRNITVLLGVIFAQLALLAWQVRSDADVPLVRVWAVTAVTPAASLIESLRNTTTGFFTNYFELRNAREQSRNLRVEVDKLRLENQFLKNDLAAAQRVESLAGFQTRTLSKMVGARVIGATPGVGSKSVLIDRGSASGVHRGMAVVTPDGIVGKVLAVFPLASQVLTVTDPGFAAGVESQNNHVHGVLKGLGGSTARVDFVPMGQKIQVGEMFFTSGEDRIFPKGLPVGRVISVRDESNFQEIVVQPTGTETAAEEVMVILDPVHQTIPEAPPADSPVFLAPDVTSDAPETAAPPSNGTMADKLLDQYKKIGDAQKHVFGEGLPGSLPPNFNLKVPGVNAPAAPPGTPTAPATAANQTAAKPAATQAPAKPTIAGGLVPPAPVKPASAPPASPVGAAIAPKPAAPLATPSAIAPLPAGRPAAPPPAPPIARPVLATPPSVPLSPPPSASAPPRP